MSEFKVVETPTVRALYYRVVTMYELPASNHTTLDRKIAALERDIGRQRAKHYLTTLLTRDIRTEPFDFKPELLSANEVYGKRLKVEAYLSRNKPVPPPKVRTATEVAQATASALSLASSLTRFVERNG